MPITERRHAQLDPSGRVLTRQLGHIQLGAVTYLLVDCGAWSSAATYQAGNLVTSGGSQYVALNATGNVAQTPPNATYWQAYDATTLHLRADRVWVTPKVPRTLEVLIDGGGTAITTGVKGDAPLDFASTIVGWTLVADQSGSIVVDVWKDSYANFPPTVADSITASAKPTLSAADHNKSSTLTGWTTAIAAGDVLRFNVSSAATVTRVTLALQLLG